MIASFTGHTLPIIANYSQALGIYPLALGLALFYWRHRCHHCWRPGRFQIGEHHVPTCHRHRSLEGEAS